MGIRQRSTAVLIAVGLCATAGTATATAYVRGHARPSGAAPADAAFARAAGRAVGHAVGITANQPQPAESVFVAVRNCLIGRTKTLASGHHVEWAVAGTDLSGQGGSKSGCTIPASATAVAGNLQSQNVRKSGADSLSAAGKGPRSPTLFLTKGRPVTAGFTQPVTPGGGPAVRVSASGTSEVSMWVNGYYTEQIQGLVYTDGSLYSGSPAITGVTPISTGLVEVSLDRDVTYCSVTATGDTSGSYAFGFTKQGTNDIVLQNWTLNSTATPVATKGYVYFVVTC